MYRSDERWVRLCTLYTNPLRHPCCNPARSGEYCGIVAHARIGVLKRYEAKFTKNGDRWGKHICQSMLSDTTCNLLKPKASSNARPAGAGSKTITEWFLKTKAAYGEFFDALISLKKREDQDERAQAFVDGWSDSRIFEGVVLDGHGRVILRIFGLLLEKFGKERLNSSRWIIPDIDPIVNQYHVSLFAGCPNVRCVESDVTSFGPVLGRAFYHNFCGISNSTRLRVVVLFQKLRQILEANPGAPCLYMVSWATRNVSVNRLKSFNSVWQNSAWKLVRLETCRDDFWTFVLKKCVQDPPVTRALQPLTTPLGNSGNHSPSLAISYSSKGGKPSVPQVAPKTKTTQPPVSGSSRASLDFFRANGWKEQLKGKLVKICDGKWAGHEGTFLSWSGTVAYINLSVGKTAFQVARLIELLN